MFELSGRRELQRTTTPLILICVHPCYPWFLLILAPTRFFAALRLTLVYRRFAFFLAAFFAGFFFAVVFFFGDFLAAFFFTGDFFLGDRVAVFFFALAGFFLGLGFFFAAFFLAAFFLAVLRLGLPKPNADSHPSLNALVAPSRTIDTFARSLFQSPQKSATATRLPHAL